MRRTRGWSWTDSEASGALPVMTRGLGDASLPAAMVAVLCCGVLWCVEIVTYVRELLVFVQCLKKLGPPAGSFPRFLAGVTKAFTDSPD